MDYEVKEILLACGIVVAMVIVASFIFIMFIL